jgi:hypothetical protein
MKRILVGVAGDYEEFYGSYVLRAYPDRLGNEFHVYNSASILGKSLIGKTVRITIEVVPADTPHGTFE